MKTQFEIALAAMKLAAVCETLELVAKGDAREAGVRVHLLAFIVGASPHRTQRELARALDLTPGRVCQMLNVIRRQFRRTG